MNYILRGYTPRPLINTFKEILIPSATQFLVAFTVSLVIFLIESARYLLNLLAGNHPVTVNYYGELTGSLLRQSSDNAVAPDLAVITIWAIAGAVVYASIFLIADFIMAIKIMVNAGQEIASDHEAGFFHLINEYRRAIWIGFFIFITGISILITSQLWLKLLPLNGSTNLAWNTIGILGLAYNLYLIVNSGLVIRHNPKLIQRREDVIHP